MSCLMLITNTRTLGNLCRCKWRWRRSCGADSAAKAAYAGCFLANCPSGGQSMCCFYNFNWSSCARSQHRDPSIGPRRARNFWQFPKQILLERICFGMHEVVASYSGDRPAGPPTKIVQSIKLLSALPTDTQCMVDFRYMHIHPSIYIYVFWGRKDGAWSTNCEHCSVKMLCN